jgi:CHAT domain-containing protein/tetratricopeptide (TPR) repeat protein
MDTAPEHIDRLNEEILRLIEEERCSEAIRRGIEASVMAQDFFGGSAPEYAEVLFSLAMLHLSVGDGAAAKPLLQKAGQIWEQSLEEHDPDRGEIALGLGMMHEMSGESTEAERFYRVAVEMSEKPVMGHSRSAASYEPRGRLHATSLHRLAEVYESRGDYETAQELHLRGLEARKTTFGRLSRFYLENLSKNSNLYRKLRLRNDEPNFANAAPFLWEALEVLAVNDMCSHPFYADRLDDLGRHYHSRGDFSTAEGLYREAMRVRARSLGADTPLYSLSLDNLAELSVAAGDPHRALELVRQSLRIEDRLVVRALVAKSERLKIAYVRMLYASACKCLSLTIEHFSGDRVAVNMAYELVLSRKAIGDEAAALQNEAVLGNRYPAVSRVASELANLRSGGSETEIAETKSETDTVCLKVCGLLLVTILFFLSSLAFSLRDVEPIEGDKALAVSFQVVILGLLLRVAIKAAMEVEVGEFMHPRQEASHSSLRNARKSQQDRAGRLEQKLSELIAKQNIERKSSGRDISSLASELPRGSALIEFVRYHVFDFIASPAHGELQWTHQNYAAFVLPAGEPESLAIVDLGEASLIDAMVAEFRAATLGEVGVSEGRDITLVRSFPPPSALAEGTRSLFDIVFRPLVPAIGERWRLFIAPDGDLSRLPFELLETPNGRCLLDDFEISYIATGRDLLRFATGSEHPTSEPLILADPDFDLEPALESNRIDLQQCHAQEPPRPGGSRESSVVDLRSLRFKRLPGTRVEGARVGELLSVRPKLGREATRELLAGCRSPSIVHLATHGFFLGDTVASRDRLEVMLSARPWMEEMSLTARREVRSYRILEQFMTRCSTIVFYALFDLADEMPGAEPLPGGLDALADSELENPLRHSGLAFSGAGSLTQDGSSLAEFGILTAADITGLNLLGTELVVLSACDTGLGEVCNGEGVAGLRRAFILAGAQALVMSLWKVDDLATAILMGRFYENLLVRGLGRSTALREAQLYLRDLKISQLREHWLSPEMIEILSADSPDAKDNLLLMARMPENRRPFALPFYWGAFICQGNPYWLEKSGELHGRAESTMALENEGNQTGSLVERICPSCRRVTLVHRGENLYCRRCQRRC